MNIPEEILQARGFLEMAEKESDPKRKINKLKEGIDLIDSYIEDNSDITAELFTFIKNLRRAHTRRLLGQLVSITEIEIEEWFQYVLMFVDRLKEEISYVTEQDSELKKNYDEFWNIWSDVLKKALKKVHET